MDGTMSVDSVEGKGSTFHIELTASEGKVPEKLGLDDGLPKLAAKRILVVDDNATNREIVSRQARSWGMEPVAVALPSEALALIESGELFDMAALDMLMPEMDGLAASRRIRSLDKPACDVPIVALTANAMQGVREQVLAAGMDEYVTKPIDRAQLLRVIARCTGGIAPEDAVVIAAAATNGPTKTEALSADAEAALESLLATLDA